MLANCKKTLKIAYQNQIFAIKRWQNGVQITRKHPFRSLAFFGALWKFKSIPLFPIYVKRAYSMLDFCCHLAPLARLAPRASLPRFASIFLVSHCPAPHLLDFAVLAHAIINLISCPLYGNIQWLESFRRCVS